MKFNTLALALGMAALGATSVAAHAQAYPNRSVRIIVPYATGGSADVLARQIGASLAKLWGQGVVVDNRPGASGNIGSTEAARAPADGYTLLLQNPTMLSNLAIMGKLPYDPVKDLTPIMLLGETPMAIVANPAANIGNVKELVAAAKAKPGGLNYGSCGVGTPMQFVMELVKEKTSIEATHAGYKGCAPLLNDVLGNQVPLAAMTASIAVPHVKSGKLKMIGVSTAQRYNQLPDVPTLDEQGLKPFDIFNWNALMGPANIPPEIVAKIAADVAKVLADPALIASLTAAGVEPNPRPASALTAVINTDKARYIKLAKDANMKPE